MHRSYDDIRSRIGEPLWWDDQCAPRYEPFKPDMLGVYEREAVLYEIACQSCAQPFKVAESWGRVVIFHSKQHGVLVEEVGPRTLEHVKTLHYGDPPIHGCVGDTMNCDDIRVLEFWRHEDWEWVRVPALEVALQDGPGAQEDALSERPAKEAVPQDAERG